MYVGKDFDPQSATETETFGLDFTGQITPSELITAAAWYCTVKPNTPGVDPTPQSHISGSAAIVGQLTYQKIVGLLDGVIYILEARVTTNQGNIVSLYAVCEGKAVQ